MSRWQASAIYDEATPPDELGEQYADLRLRVLLNPSKAQWQAFLDALQTTADPAAVGRALHTFYGTTPAEDGWDFSSPQAAQATLDQDDMPDEVAYWLLQLPFEITRRRRELLAKTLGASFAPIPA